MKLIKAWKLSNGEDSITISVAQYEQLKSTPWLVATRLGANTWTIKRSFILR